MVEMVVAVRELSGLSPFRRLSIGRLVNYWVTPTVRPLLLYGHYTVGAYPAFSAVRDNVLLVLLKDRGIG